MPLRPLYGHEAVRQRLATAVQARRLPQAILLEGPQGVGKQRLALWLGQLLHCARGQVEPCGSCQSCQLVINLSHPDLHWFIPLEPSRKAGDADKQVEAVEDALLVEMAERRQQPLYEPPQGMAVHSIAAVRLLLRRASLTPAVSARKVFIIGDCERLVPQPSSPEAANALLKVLEEPLEDTFFVLTAAEPASLLPTLLSRVVRVKVQRLPDSVVTSFIQTEITSPKNTSDLVHAAEGSIGRVLALYTRARKGSTGGGDPADDFLARLRGNSVDRYVASLRQTPFQARGGFTDMLDGLLERLRREARDGGGGRRILEAIALVLEAREQAQSNVNPQLLAAVLADDLTARR